MREWQEQAIILRCGYFREADLWLRALFRTRGLLTVFAFGGAKSRRRFCGCLDQFNTLECRVRASRNGAYLGLEEASLKNGPVRLRQDWRGMGIAANCLRFAEACGTGPEAAPECFDIIEDLRACLEQPGEAGGYLPVFFRLRFAAALGYAPDFAMCSGCGEAIRTGGRFLVDEGRCLCQGCASGQRHSRHSITLAQPALDLLQNVQHNLPRCWPPDAAGAALRQAARAIDGFVQFHLGLEWENGTFRRI